MASTGAFGSPGIFDELTDADLSGVKAVHSPGAAAAAAPAPSANTAKLLDEAINAGDSRGKALSMQGLAPRPGFLIFVAIANALWSVIYFLLALVMFGLVAALPVLEEEAEVGGGVLSILGISMLLIGILSIATTFACIIRSKASWYIILVSYSWGFADRVMGVIRDLSDDDIEVNYVKVASAILIGAGIWMYMHGEDVRAFYQTEKEPMGKIIGANAAGLVLGVMIGLFVLFL